VNGGMSAENEFKEGSAVGKGKDHVVHQSGETMNRLNHLNGGGDEVIILQKSVVLNQGGYTKQHAGREVVLARTANHIEQERSSRVEAARNSLMAVVARRCDRGIICKQISALEEGRSRTGWGGKK